jgi:hypothetical protein
MAYIAITDAEVAAGQPVDQTLMQKIKDDMDYVYAQIGAPHGLLPNGSMEFDTDADGVPDAWEVDYYAGGSGAIDTTTPMFGDHGWTFTHPGGIPLRIDAILMASSATMHVVVQVLWYTVAKVYISATDVYDRETNNPTSAARIGPLVIPPATARFFKVRLIGGVNDNTTAGTVSFGGVDAERNAYTGTIRAVLAELTSANASWVTVGTVTVILPVVSSSGHIRLTFQAEAKNSGGQQRFLIGTTYSNTVAGGSGVYTNAVYTMDILGAGGGAVTLNQQMIADSGTTYGKKERPEIMVEVIHA